MRDEGAERSRVFRAAYRPQTPGHPRGEKSGAKTEFEGRQVWWGATSSRFENGHSLSSVETLQKRAGAWGTPFDQVFYEGGASPWTRRRSPELFRI